uniref:hypothetical protein n=1 Tax=Flavobacterium sp. TaxID=239 RepID=UPI004048AC8D
MIDAILGAYSAHQYNKSQEQIAAEANAASAASVAAQMNFQREMSNTSFQRAVADMRSAGINPMLAAMRGGASTPGGASYMAQMPQQKDIGAAAIQAFQGGSSARESMARIDQVDATVDKIREEIKNIPTEGDRLKATVALLYEQQQLMSQQNYTSKAQMAVLNATINKLILETDLVRGSVQAMKQLDNLGKTFEAAKPIIDALKIFLGRR